MKTILSKQGYLIPINDDNKELIKNIKKELTVKPIIPFQYSFIKKQPPKIEVFQEYEKYLSVPKYYGLSKFGKPYKNKEHEGNKINIKFTGELRDKQKEIINNILPHINNIGGGVLCLPCAAGKTVLSLYLISQFKVKTLVIVHKAFLLNQWKERAEQFTNAKIGILQRDKIDVEGKDIVIGMLQSIAKDKYDENIFKDFGMVIFDEAHHAPSKYFSRSLPIIASKITIGLSATPKRTDGLEKILYWYFGDIMYKMETTKNNNVQVNIIKYNIEHDKFKEYYLKSGDVNRPKTINKITTIGRRNKFIIDYVQEVLEENPGRKILVLSDRIEHLKLLKTRLDGRELTTSDFYIGGMKQSLLDKAEKAQVIFASYGMAAEALDIPDLNTLFMVTSRKEVEQAVGRIIRKVDPNIRPTIYDFTDQIACFVNQGYSRRRFYKNKGFEIKIIDVFNNVIKKETDLSEINDISEININDNNDIKESKNIDFID